MQEIEEIDGNAYIDKSPVDDYADWVSRLCGPSAELGKDTADGVEVDGLGFYERVNDFCMEFCSWV